MLFSINIFNLNFINIKQCSLLSKGSFFSKFLFCLLDHCVKCRRVMWSVPYKSAKQQKSKPCVITVIMWFWLFYVMKFVALFTIHLEHGYYSCNWALILIWQSLSSYSYCFKKLNFKKVCNINSNVLYDNWWDVLFTICLY